MKFSFYTYFLFGALILPFSAMAQDDPMKLLEQRDSVKNEVVSATFKGTHVINFNSVETVGPRTLEFQIQHRFGPFNSGGYNLFGLDQGATIRLGLSYSFNGKFEFGIGRSSIDKQYDTYVKSRVLRQSIGKMPVSLTLFGGAYYTTVHDNQVVPGIDRYEYTSSRFSYVAQAIVARKFNENLSLQLSPMLIHYNLVDKITDKNDIMALGLAGRYKLTRRMALTTEYGLRINNYSLQQYYNSFGLGWEIETGGHVFQVVFTNSLGITENQFIPYTNTKWSNAGIRLGFNISRVFTL
ncbi:DUF5777 family beta-barrel protein [Solitalea koreensis]|uniref:DUF5777 domain-containing protein n=1 Tax=Solitalea koreensis TaxID=543615 RepID=A0A521B9V0_9SPHI|nr:DUF5777 family beta-barrel protein [Solitalea koreensis]SMO43801.1 hypothetical protein SAMN06265350_10222 [Solitalea koreensis]